MLHLEIVRERLEREFDLDLISTLPNVEYDVTLEGGVHVDVTNPSEFPDGKISEVREPVVRATILAPSEFIGAIMELCQQRRGSLRGMDYLSPERVELRYTLPLAEIVFDFFDQLKSRTRGYASLDYEPDGEQAADLVRVDILLQGEQVDAFSSIVHKDKAYAYGVAMASKLRELIPRQQFEVPIQAAIGSRVIARENIRAMRKDVLAKCYGGDITRKRKLLEKQKEGKKRMKMVGRVEVPQEAFIAALSNDGETRQEVGLSPGRPSLASVREHYTHTFGPPLDRFVTLAVGYRYAGGPPGVHVGMPSGALTLVVPFDEPLRLSGAGLAEPTPFDGVLAGLATGPTLIHHDGHQHGLQLGLTPSGARAVFGMPAAELAESSVRLEDVVGTGRAVAPGGARGVCDVGGAVRRGRTGGPRADEPARVAVPGRGPGGGAGLAADPARRRPDPGGRRRVRRRVVDAAPGAPVPVRVRHHAQGGGADHPVRALGRRRPRPPPAARRRRRRVRVCGPGAPRAGVA